MVSGGWLCEHRWLQIANMVGWRNVVAGGDWKLYNRLNSGSNNNFVAFSRCGSTVGSNCKMGTDGRFEKGALRACFFCRFRRGRRLAV